MDEIIVRLIKAAEDIEELLTEGLTDTQNDSWGREVDEFLYALAEYRSNIKAESVK